MHVLIGLGNPGSEYDGTRHNVGFSVIDAIAKHLDVHLSSGKGEYLVGKSLSCGPPVLLVKPLTYMNNSGYALKDVLMYYKAVTENMLVICDDFQLPLGTLRMRTKGSDGGHNGLHSIINNLQTENFPRLRCGIASEHLPKRKTAMAQFVLSSFENDEESVVQQMILRARDAALTFATKGLTVAMNLFNTSR